MDLLLGRFSILYLGTNLHAWDLGLSTKQAEILISKTLATAETAVVDFEKIFVQTIYFLLDNFFSPLPFASGCLQWRSRDFFGPLILLCGTAAWTRLFCPM